MTRGAQGLQGRDGQDGAQGLPGRDGRDGAAGRDGRDGKDVLNGKVDPTTEGKDGDKYVNTETGDVFVKNNDTWDKAGNIKGPKGDKGAEGAQGLQGEKGETGAPGEKGDKGDTPEVTTARGKDGHSTDITFTLAGEEPVVANIKDGKDGRTPNLDLNALAEAAVRLNNQEVEE